MDNSVFPIIRSSAAQSDTVRPIIFLCKLTWQSYLSISLYCFYVCSENTVTHHRKYSHMYSPFCTLYRKSQSLQNP